MWTLIDTSLWIDFTRARSPRRLKEFIAPLILDPAAHLAEPIVFEILRHATADEHRQLTQQFQTFPMLATPGDIWSRAAKLGQLCRERGVQAGSLDLLITCVAIHHGAELITFDQGFQPISAVADLRVKILSRPD